MVSSSISPSLPSTIAPPLQPANKSDAKRLLDQVPLSPKTLEFLKSEFKKLSEEKRVKCTLAWHTLSHVPVPTSPELWHRIPQFPDRYPQLKADLAAFRQEISLLMGNSNPTLPLLLQCLDKIQKIYDLQNTQAQFIIDNLRKIPKEELKSAALQFLALEKRLSLWLGVLGRLLQSPEDKKLIAEAERQEWDKKVAAFIGNVQSLAKTLPIKTSLLSSIKKIYLSILDKIPLLESNHLTEFRAARKQKSQKLQNEIRELTYAAEQIIDRYPTALNKPFYRHLSLLLFSLIPGLKRSPFSKQNKFPLIFQHLLSPELERLRLEKKNNPLLAATPEHILKRKIAKAQLALSLGHGSAANKGTTGTRLVLDINNKPIGVHKVDHRDIPVSLQIKNLFQSFFGQLSFLSKKSMARPQTEKMAYYFSRDLGFNLAPPSANALLKYKGVLQLFVSHEKTDGNPYSHPEYVEASAALDELNRNHFTDTELTIFQKFTLFDFLIGNLDRHEENWFVIFETQPDGTKLLTHIKAIDNANAFPKKYPRPFHKKDPTPLDLYLSPGRNQYKWKNLQIAKFPFTGEVKNFVKTNLSKENIQLFLDKQKKDMPDFFDQNMIRLFLQRAEKMREMVLEDKKTETPETLAKTAARDFW